MAPFMVGDASIGLNVVCSLRSAELSAEAASRSPLAEREGYKRASSRYEIIRLFRRVGLNIVIRASRYRVMRRGALVRRWQIGLG